MSYSILEYKNDKKIFYFENNNENSVIYVSYDQYIIAKLTKLNCDKIFLVQYVKDLLILNQYYQNL